MLVFGLSFLWQIKTEGFSDLPYVYFVLTAALFLLFIAIGAFVIKVEEINEEDNIKEEDSLDEKAASKESMGTICKNYLYKAKEDDRIGFLVIVGLFYPLVHLIGFTISSGLVVIFLFIYLNRQFKIWHLIYGAIVILFIYLFFNLLVRYPLPSGWLNLL